MCKGAGRRISVSCSIRNRHHQSQCRGYHDPAYALGLKFHYLRDQAGIATKSVAQKAQPGCCDDNIH